MSVSTTGALTQSRTILDWVESARPENLNDLRTTLVAAQSLPGSLERVNAPSFLQDMIGKIGELPAELQPHVIAQMSTKIQELYKVILMKAPQDEKREGAESLEPVRKRTREESACSASAEDILEPLGKHPTETSLLNLMGLPFQTIFGFLDQPSQRSLAQASTICREAVHQARRNTLERFRGHEGLQELLPFFLNHPPSEERLEEQQYIRWTALLDEKSELYEVVTKSLECILRSDFLNKKEKEALPFHGKSVQDIICDPTLLYSLLETEYNRNLLLVSGITGVDRPDLRDCTLNEMAEAARTYLQGRKKDLWMMNLTHNDLTCLPKEIFLLTRLKYLCLEHNFLRVLPDLFGPFQELETLDLSKNQLQSLPSSITSLRALQSLLSPDNHLKALPDSLDSLEELDDLDVSQNELQSLPNSIGALQKLGSLFLPNNPLKSLPDSILTLPRLSLFILDDDQAKTFSDMVEMLKSLKGSSIQTPH